MKSLRRVPGSAAFCCALLASNFTFANAVGNAASAQEQASANAMGAIELYVDATDLEHRIFRVRESMPVTPGAMTLWYPLWVPGAHSPSGPIDALAGLRIEAAGQRIEWTRDPMQTHSFRVEIPPGVRRIDIQFQYVSPTAPTRGRITMTQAILGVQWEKVVLYPGGKPARQIDVAPSLRLPEGWGFGTSLVASPSSDAITRFHPVTLDTLVDSPVFAGRHFVRNDLDPGAPVPVVLDIVADTPQEISPSDSYLGPHRRLIREAYTALGPPPFDRYHFLFAISNQFGGIGLEHLASSENAVTRGYFRDWDASETYRTLFPHEFVHAWCGKSRRPVGLATSSLELPMRGELLWVYEGLTQYWGEVLAARSGLRSREITLGSFAEIAARLSRHRSGREWRNLQDTTYEPVMKFGAAEWPSWQRSYDYYDEGLLLWLSVDATIRGQTGGRRSLDDFSRRFLRPSGVATSPSTYTYVDVIHALDEVAVYDWRTFIRQFLDGHTAQTLLSGLDSAGWRLVFKDAPSKFTASSGRYHGVTDFSHSIGLILGADADVAEVIWDSPAFAAGLSAAASIVAVNGNAYSTDALEQAISNASDAQPIDLLVREFDRYRTVTLHYRGGLKYPHLEKIVGREDMLALILAARAQ